MKVAGIRLHPSSAPWRDGQQMRQLLTIGDSARAAGTRIRAQVIDWWNQVSELGKEVTELGGWRARGLAHC